MKRKKTFAFASSVIEIVLSCVYFVVFAIVLIDLLLNYVAIEEVYLLPEAIFTVCIMFTLSVMMIVDGIISLKASKASDERFENFKGALLGMGIVMCVLALLGLFTFSLFYFFSGVIVLLSFFLLILIGVFKILSATLSNGEEEEQMENVAKVCPDQVQSSEEKKMETLLVRIEKINDLYKAGLISNEEFENLKNNILSK